MEIKVKSVYEVLIDLPKHFCKFDSTSRGYTSLLKFDFRDHTISNGTAKVVYKGEPMESVSLTDNSYYIQDKLPLMTGHELEHYGITDMFSDPYKVIETLYTLYERSVPSERNKFSRSHFAAVSVDDLSFDELRHNIDRTTAQYLLEGYILLMSIEKRIPWENPDEFYWQSPSHSKLILMKEWIIC